MSGLFYILGRKAGPKIRKAKWVWQSVTGSQSDVIAAEYGVGCDLAAALRMQIKCDNTSDDAIMINDIGERLSARVANKLRKFNFEVIADGPPNAFALPGGFVFVTRSMLELCKRDKDELAFILGHEMGHIVKGHAMDRLVSSTAFSTLSRRMPGGGAIRTWMKSTGLKLLESAYSQQNEYTADNFGTQLAIAARYDKAAATKLLIRLGQLGNGSGNTVLAKYFSTHPPIPDRVANVKKVITEQAS